MTSKELKVFWYDTPALNRMIDSAKVLEIECPYCGQSYEYGMTHGDIFQSVQSVLDVVCLKCEKVFGVAWAGDDMNEREIFGVEQFEDEDGNLPF